VPVEGGVVGEADDAEPWAGRASDVDVGGGLEGVQVLADAQYRIRPASPRPAPTVPPAAEVSEAWAFVPPAGYFWRPDPRQSTDSDNSKKRPRHAPIAPFTAYTAPNT
jgi:hypothetical protein